MYHGTTILSGTAPGRRRDRTPDSHPAEHDMLAHTPDPAKYHAGAGGTLLPRSDRLGGSTAFNTSDVFPVVIDPLDPYDPSTGTVVDYNELRRKSLDAQQGEPDLPPVKTNVPQQQIAGGPQLLQFNVQPAPTKSAQEEAPAFVPSPSPAAPVVPDTAQMQALLQDLFSRLPAGSQPSIMVSPPTPAPPAPPPSAKPLPQAQTSGPLALLASAEPQRPRRPVVFRLPGGTYRQHFHHVSKRGNSIFLFFDDRYTSDSRFQPNPTDADGDPITVILPEEDDATYQVHVLPLSNNLDYVDIIQLLICESPGQFVPASAEEEAQAVDLMDLSPYGGATGA